MMFASEVYLGDCLAAMKLYPAGCFDLAVVDTPYGINATKMQMGSAPNRKGKGQYPGISTVVKLKGRLNSGGGKLKNRILNRSDIDWDNEVPTQEYFDELFRISRNQIIWGGNYFDLPPSRCWICWDKMQPWDNFSQFELAWTSFDKPTKMYRISNTGGANRETKIHPTQKPVELYDCVFRDFATENMRVIDTHLGSGSSRISACKANVHFYAYEKNEIHYKDQEERFANFKRHTRMSFVEEVKPAVQMGLWGI